MRVDKPFAAITPTLDGDALLVLARTDHPMTVPAIVAAARFGSEAGMRKALRRLTEQGLVIRERTGHHDSYVLNNSHLLAPAIDMVAKAGVELRARLAKAVSVWEPTPAFVALFGSAAYGAMSTDSDIDVLVVRPDIVDVDDPAWCDQVISLSEAGRSWTGNDVRILELSEEETRSAATAGEQVILDIAAYGHRIFGEMPSHSLATWA